METSTGRPALPRRTIKCVAVGDRIFGRPVCSRQSPRGSRLSMPFESYSVGLQVGDEPCTLELFYAADQEDLDGLRPQQWYQQADVFLVCLPVDNPGALRTVKAKWLPEIERYCRKGTPFLLVGTRIDRRDQDGTEGVGGKKFLTKDQGVKIARKLKAANYVECSTKTNVGLEDVFLEMVMAALEPKISDEKRGFKLFR